MAPIIRDTTRATTEGSPRAETIAEAFASYRLEARLGRGNRATVYRAVDRQNGNVLALRVFDRKLTAEPTFAAQFGEVVAALTAAPHPNLLPILAHGVHDGWAYLARPYIVGDNLRRRLGTPLRLNEALRLLRPVAAALDHAHAAGIVHGDLKPGNILLPASGQAVITDAGIVGLLPRANTLLSAATGRYYGTPEYLAPEQAHGLALNGQADIYALGVIFYEALTGRPPFRGATPRLIVSQHISALPPAFEEELQGLAAVESIIAQALAKDPTRRPATAGALIAALEAVGGVDGPTRVFAATAIPGTTLLTQEGTSMLAAPLSSLPADDMAAQHTAELAELRASYEARLDEQAERAQEREQDLLAQLAALRDECVTLVDRADAATALAQERDALTKRVRKLEQLVRSVTNAASSPTGGRLVLINAQQAGRPEGTSIPLVPDAVLGRHPDCAILLADDFISGHHARLTWEVGAWWLVDLGTLNGTLINGERIARPTQLRDRDVVRIGRVQARVALDPPAVTNDAGQVKQRAR